MSLDELKAQYWRDKAAGVAEAGLKLLERAPEHFEELLHWLIEVNGDECARIRARAWQQLVKKGESTKGMTHEWRQRHLSA